MQNTCILFVIQYNGYQVGRWCPTAKPTKVKQTMSVFSTTISLVMTDCESFVEATKNAFSKVRDIRGLAKNEQTIVNALEQKALKGAAACDAGSNTHVHTLALTYAERFVRGELVGIINRTRSVQSVGAFFATKNIKAIEKVVKFCEALTFNDTRSVDAHTAIVFNALGELNRDTINTRSARVANSQEVEHDSNESTRITRAVYNVGTANTQVSSTMNALVALGLMTSNGASKNIEYKFVSGEDSEARNEVLQDLITIAKGRKINRKANQA